MNSDVPSPYRALALGVLYRAMADALGIHNRGPEWEHHKAEIMEEARAWLESDEAMLPFWCKVAGVSPERFREQALRHLAAGKLPRLAF